FTKYRTRSLPSIGDRGFRACWRDGHAHFEECGARRAGEPYGAGGAEDAAGDGDAQTRAGVDAEGFAVDCTRLVALGVEAGAGQGEGRAVVGGIRAERDVPAGRALDGGGDHHVEGTPEPFAVRNDRRQPVDGRGLDLDGVGVREGLRVRECGLGERVEIDGRGVVA